MQTQGHSRLGPGQSESWPRRSSAQTTSVCTASEVTLRVGSFCQLLSPLAETLPPMCPFCLGGNPTSCLSLP